MNINSELIKVAKSLVADFGIDANSNFWQDVFVKSFSDNDFKNGTFDRNMYNNRLRKFFQVLEQTLQKAHGRDYFYSHLQSFKINPDKGIDAVISVVKKNDREDIRLYFGADTNEGKVYVNGSYPQGDRKSISNIVETIIKTYEQ